MKPLLVVKLGSAILTAGTDRVSRGKIEDVARQLCNLKDVYDVVLVSSGAIATAKQFIEIDGWENVVASKQAMSAIGQPRLMQIYQEVFSDFGIRIAQCLMTYRDFENSNSRRNTLNTVLELIKHDYLPIINENDTVATEEIMLGDNDKLSAKVATLIEADTLVLASDIDGLYTKNPHINSDAKLLTEVSDLSDLDKYIEEKDNGLGTGGMTSKIEAARICSEAGIRTIIVNGRRENFIIDCLKAEIPHTRFG